MEELKEFLSTHPHVKTVYFDKDDNWYINKVRTSVKEMSREDILGGGKKKAKKEETNENN